jgi:hypothetical protein
MKNFPITGETIKKVATINNMAIKAGCTSSSFHFPA